MKMGEKVWLCKRTSTEGADVITYGNPIAYTLKFNYLTVQPTTVALNNMSGFYTTEDFGEHTANGWNVTANYDAFVGQVNPGDLMYLDGVSPTANTTNGTGANGYVTSIREQNKLIFFTVNKIEGS